MKKVTGIKSVDFKIIARGHGAVNWNGSTEVLTFILKENKWKPTNNHNMPKLRGYTNKETIENKEGKEFLGVKKATDINFKETPLYISQNCIRYHLFKDDLINWQHQEIHENVDKILCSMTGLLRGYVIPKNENKRTSPLLLTDFTEVTGNGNFEQYSKLEMEETIDPDGKINYKRGDKSFFSKTTFGDTKYEAFGSINIEQLQFISLSNAYGQEAMRITTDTEGEELAQKIEKYIKTLESANDKVKATYHKKYIRQGTIFADGQQGIVLNDDAIDALVKQMLMMIENLGFRQAKGFMYVESIEVDYNNFENAKDMFRLKKGSGETNPEKIEPYAIYYKAGE